MNTWFTLTLKSHGETICTFTTYSYKEAEEIAEIGKNLGYEVIWNDDI